MTARRRRRQERRKRTTSGRVRRLVAYCRVSTDEQAQRGQSIRTQRERLRAFAAANNAELIVFEIDDGISGFKPPERRPALSRALELVHTGQADGIVATTLDRLSRNALETMKLVSRTEAEGWDLVTLDLEIDTTTAMGRAQAGFAAVMAQQWRDAIAERTQQTMDRLAREGKRRSGKPPFGWRIGASDRLVKEATEQATLRRILELDGEEMGPQGIANQLNAERRRQRNGRPWSRQRVWQTLDTYLALEDASRA